MSAKTVVMIAAAGAGLFLLMKSGGANAATKAAASRAPSKRTRANMPGLPKLQLDSLSKALGATWIVPSWSVQTVSYDPGESIGVYGGMTQDQANTQAVVDYNNQFLSPYSTGYGVAR